MNAFTRMLRPRQLVILILVSALPVLLGAANLTEAARLRVSPVSTAALDPAAQTDPIQERAGAGALAQAQPDLILDDLIVTQAVNDEPLILGKATVVRLIVSAAGGSPIPAQVTVDWNGKTYTQETTVNGAGNIVNVNVDPPSSLQTWQIQAQVAPIGGANDSNPSNNARSVSVPTIWPEQKIKAFFLPVDWTPEQRERYKFSEAFPQFVVANQEFLRGTYPLGTEQLEVDYTLTPHMLAASEKRLATNEGAEDTHSMHLLYASIARAARRLSPDANLVVGVFPPGWYARHGRTSTVGLALADVRGTVTAQYVLSDATTTAHELAHLYWMYEDYDYAVDPPRPYTWVDKSGYWVQRNTPQDVTGNKRIPTFLSSYSPELPSWVDTRIYQYLTAKFVVNGGGDSSEPLVLAATMARSIEPDERDYPSDYAAGFQRFEPKQPVYVSVAVSRMSAGQRLQARWYYGNQELGSQERETLEGAGWYAFRLADRNGLKEGKYRVEIYLDGQLAKTTPFEVKRGAQ